MGENNFDYRLLTNEMNDKELQQIVDEQAMICFESPDVVTLSPTAVALKINQTRDARHAKGYDDVKAESKPPEWITNSPLGGLANGATEAYRTSYRAIADAVEVQQKAAQAAKVGFCSIYKGMIDVFELASIDFNHLLEEAGKEIRRASPGKERDEVSQAQRKKLLEAGLKITNTIENEILKVKTPEEATSEKKDRWKAAIQEKFPQYRAKMYENRTIAAGESHGLERIIAQIKSPAAADTFIEAVKSSLRAQEKLNSTPKVEV